MNDLTPRQLEQLIEDYTPLVRALAARMAPGGGRDEDLLQCGRIGLWEAARHWDGRPPFAPLARRCAAHNMLDHLRRARRLSRCDARAQALPPEPEGREEEPGWMDRLDFTARVHAAWPPNSRERFVLTALSKGLSKGSVAAALGLDTRQVTRLARRAWERVRRAEEGPK